MAMDNIDEDAINIYTDGSSYSSPRAGGVGMQFVTVGDDGHEVIEDHELVGYQGANNQQMALKACIDALSLLGRGRTDIEAGRFRKIIINTDSMYVVEHFNTAKFTWPANKWTTRDGAPVANAALWKNLTKIAANSGKRVEIRWVKGHKSSVHNKAADKLAKGSAKRPANPPLSVVSVRRKKTAKSIERGSVVLSGQRLTIRIVTDERLTVQRCWKYKYEVMSKASPYFGNVDLAYSEILLRAGHSYYVRFGEETKNPWIVKVFREVAPAGANPAEVAT